MVTVARLHVAERREATALVLGHRDLLPADAPLLCARSEARELSAHVRGLPRQLRREVHALVPVDVEPVELRRLEAARVALVRRDELQLTAAALQPQALQDRALLALLREGLVAPHGAVEDVVPLHARRHLDARELEHRRHQVDVLHPLGAHLPAALVERQLHEERHAHLLVVERRAVPEAAVLA